MANREHENSKAVLGASERKLWFRSDIIVIFVLLIAAAVIYFIYAAVFHQSGRPYCEIVIDGETVMTVDLTKDKRFTTEQLPYVEFEIKNGMIAFIESDCPDKVCIQSGYLHQAGQTAACLPNHIAIRIKSHDNADTPDVVI